MVSAPGGATEETAMNRKLMFGIATFFAIVGLALTVSEQEVQAGRRCGGRVIGCQGGGCGGGLFSRLHRNRCCGEQPVQCCGQPVSCPEPCEPACPPKCGGCAGKCHGGLLARLRARRAARRCCGPVNTCCGPQPECPPEPCCPPPPSCCGAPAEVHHDAEPAADDVPSVPAAPAPDAA